MTLRSTLDGRFWPAAVSATLLSLLILGIPSAVIPNPLFIRMLPTDAVNVAVWLLSAPLAGLIIATYVAKPHLSGFTAGGDRGFVPASAGGVAAYLAIACPICNKIIVAVLGVSGALNVIAPLQPLIGVASIAMLAATLVWRLRQRSRNCSFCAPIAATDRQAAS